MKVVNSRKIPKNELYPLTVKVALKHVFTYVYSAE